MPNDEEKQSEKEQAKAGRKYNREYYRKNKEKILQRKKQRYENDPDYRERVKKARQRQLQREKIARRKRDTPRRTEKPPKPMKVTLPNGDVAVAHMRKRGQFAHMLGMSAQTIRKWEKDNILPRASYKTSGGHSLYTNDQVVAVKEVYEKYAVKDGPWRLTDKFVAEVHEVWNALDGGMSVETITEAKKEIAYGKQEAYEAE